MRHVPCRCLISEAPRQTGVFTFAPFVLIKLYGMSSNPQMRAIQETAEAQDCRKRTESDEPVPLPHKKVFWYNARLIKKLTRGVEMIGCKNDLHHISRIITIY